MAEVRTQVDISCARCGSSLGVAFSGKVVKEHYSLQVYPCMKCSSPKSDGERNDSALVDKKALNISKDTINVEEAAKSLEVPGKISSLPSGTQHTNCKMPDNCELCPAVPGVVNGKLGCAYGPKNGVHCEAKLFRHFANL